ncbi:MAG: AbrB family transcriptional regulator [Inquilinaceae bacterium]
MLRRAAGTLKTVSLRFRSVDYRRLVLALVIGTAGGALLAHYQLPLAWMIGAMLFTSIAALSRLPVAVPAPLRAGMIMILGIMLGGAFRPEILGQLGEWSLSLAGLIAYILVSIVVGLVFLRRVAGYDPVTAFFTATPGGFNEMVLIGGAMGGNDRVIALSHSARVMLVVFTIPFWFRFAVGIETSDRGPLGPSLGDIPPLDVALLAACVVGVPIARRLRLPAPALVGPMILSAVIHLAGLTASSPPGVLIAAAQVVVGSAIGCRFAGTPLRVLGHALLIAFGLTALLLGVTTAFAFAVHHLTGIGLIDLVLAYAPGGLAEMSLVALALGADAAFVATHHVARVILIILFAPLIFTLGKRLLVPVSGAASGAEAKKISEKDKKELDRRG